MPDSSCKHEIIRDGKSITELGFTELMDGVSTDPRFKDGYVAWTLVKREAEKLIPKVGNKIKQPSKANFDAWTDTPPFIIKY